MTQENLVEDDDDVHQLDESLGAIHQVAWMLQYMSTHAELNKDSAVALQNFAKGLAIAHEKIQKYLIEESA